MVDWRGIRGTTALLRHTLRTERVRFFVWVLSFFVLMSVVTYVNGQFTAQEMKELVIHSTGEPGMRMLVSPITAEGAGEISRFVFFRFSFVFSLLVVLMNIQIANRLTRHEEETRRADLIATSGAGRYARLLSALLVLVGLNFAVALAMWGGLLINGIEPFGSLIAGLSYGALGVVFAALTACAAQLSSHVSGVAAISGFTFAGVFLINSLAGARGTVEGEIVNDTLHFQGFEASSLAYLSPMGWTQEIYPFDDRNLWIFLLFAAAFIVLTSAAFALVDKRDVGAGVLRERKGRERSGPISLRPLGLALRLDRGVMLGWLFGTMFMAFVFGAAVGDLGVAFEDHAVFGEVFTEAAEQFPFMLISVFAMAVPFYARAAVLRMRREEATGPLELGLSTTLSKARWLTSKVLMLIAFSFLCLFAATLSLGFAMEASLGEIGEFLAAAAFQGGAAFVLTGLFLVFLALVPRQTGALSLAVIILSIAVGSWFGPMLDLPQRVMDFSPFSHVAFEPENAEPLRIALLYGFGMTACAIGITGFLRRDFQPSR